MRSVRLACVLILLGAALMAGAISAVPVAAATLITDCGDSGASTLRGVLATASAGDTLAYAQDCMTTLGSTLMLTQNVTIGGNGHTVVLDGNNAVPVITVNTAVTVALIGLTIQHGQNQNPYAGQSGNGGGISNNGGILNVTNSTITDNLAFKGGGISNISGTVTVTDSMLTNNMGSGIYNETGTVNITHDTISQNRGGTGGGISNEDGTLNVTNSMLSGNSANYGGGIWTANPTSIMNVTNSTLSGNTSVYEGGGIDTSSNCGTVNLTDSTLSGNTITGSDHRGGGVYIGIYCTVNVTYSVLSGNGATGDFSSGGGIYSTGTLTMTNSTLSGNSVNSLSFGGGILNDSGGILTMTNSTLSGNSAHRGGGIYTSGTLVATNSTLSGNNADYGGGIETVASMLTLHNTIVAANVAMNGPDILGFVNTTSHNLVSSTSGFTGITNGVSGDIVTPTPLLGPLGFYGGTTQTIPLLPGSPAIDAGDDTTCAAPSAGNVNGLDQRGIARPQGTHCDIGAYEYVFPAPTISGVSPVSGSVAGGESVTITGTGFRAGAAVSFGSVAATGVTVVNVGQIVVISPAHAVGAVDVTVLNVDRTSATKAGGFDYKLRPGPSLPGSAPAAMPGGGRASGGSGQQPPDPMPIHR